MHTAHSLTDLVVSAGGGMPPAMHAPQHAHPLLCIPPAMHAHRPATHTPPPCIPPAMHDPPPSTPPAMHAPCHTCPLPQTPPCHTHPYHRHPLPRMPPAMHTTPPCYECPLPHMPATPPPAPVDRQTPVKLRKLRLRAVKMRNVGKNWSIKGMGDTWDLTFLFMLNVSVLEGLFTKSKSECENRFCKKRWLLFIRKTNTLSPRVTVSGKKVCIVTIDSLFARILW